MLITAQTLVTGREVLRPGWIDVSGGVVAAVGAGPAPRPADYQLATVVPGFVDTHVHGGGGADFSTASTTATATATALHRAHGSTTLVASLVTAGPAELLHQVRVLVADVRAGVIDGVHLEGPWLSTARCGAHQPTLMRDPDPAEIDRVLDAGDGTIRMITVAPETRRCPHRDPADRRRGSRGRSRPHRGHLRADHGGDRRGRHRRYPPVQRDAARSTGVSRAPSSPCSKTPR